MYARIVRFEQWRIVVNCPYRSKSDTEDNNFEIQYPRKFALIRSVTDFSNTVYDRVRIFGEHAENESSEKLVNLLVC